MHARRYLFERLAGIEAKGFDVRRAVSDQVQRLVTTLPMGEPDEALAEGPHLINFGLPPAVDFGYMTPAERELSAEHLCALLCEFEPRLTHPTVNFTGAISGDAPLSIDIGGRLEGGEEGEIIHFRVNHNGVTGG
jgi:predicted component of type VI protein secretion system